MPQRGALDEWLESLQALGRYTFSRREAAEKFGEWPNVRRILNRLRRESRVVLLRTGFYMIVPPEYRRQGAPPASWFVDSLMDHLGQPYYVGLLSAAAVHGAAHHRPQAFQVVTDRPTRDLDAGSVRVEFIQNGQLGQTPTRQTTTETGYMTVSTPEGTAIDLVRYPERAGGLANVATVLVELAEVLDTSEMARALRAGELEVPTAYIQRLGYLLERSGQDSLALPLAAYVLDQRPRWTSLVAGRSPGEGERLETWRLSVVEPVLPET